jgi:hypothetical protein
MSKLFKVFTIAVMIVALLVGSVALAGPGRGSSSGDPDSPQCVRPLTMGHSDLGDSHGKGTVDQGRSKAGVDVVQDRWIRWLRAYLRVVRLWSI